VTSSWPAGALPSPITVDDVAALLDLQLTDEQRQAIGADLAPGVIVAGAGSGKTAVMAARVVYLVGARLVRPEQVLGLTFTNKAAAELAARVRTALGRLRDTPWAPDSDVGDEPTVATYNAYAGRLVADHGLRIGVEPSSRLITRAQQWQLASRAVRSHRGEISYLALQPRSVVAQVLELAGQLADHLADAADVHAEHERLRARLAELGEPLDKQLAEVLVCLGKRDELLEFVESYQRLKEERELIDFGDQVAHAARVARLRPEVGEIERAQHAVVLLDEYQDTGVAQRLMLQALYCGGHPVTAVGDPCQSIYGWRGASVGNLVHFPEHFPRADGRPAGVHYLSTNFRSGGRVLALANATSASLRDATAAVHVPELRPGPARSRPAAWSPRSSPPPTTRRSGWPTTSRRRSPAGPRCRRSRCWPASARSSSRSAGRSRRGTSRSRWSASAGCSTPPRSTTWSPSSSCCTTRRPTSRSSGCSPGRAGGSARATSPPSGRAPASSPAAAPGATTRSPTRWRDVDVADVGSLLDALDDPGDPGRYSPEAVQRFHDIATELRTLRQRAAQPLTDLIQDVERTIGLDVELMASPRLAGQGREANVAASSTRPPGSSDLTARTTSRRSSPTCRPRATRTTAWTSACRRRRRRSSCSRCTRPRGLEWDVVFVPGLSTGTKSSVFPNKSTLTGWITAAQQVPYPLRGDRADLPSWTDISKAGKAEFLHACRERDIVEERRLAYVAFTRARSLLHLSGYHWGATQASPFGPSVFLQEAADAGLADVDVWTDAPAAGAVNPAAGRVVDVGWPAPDSAGHHAVAASAAAVRRVLAKAAAGLAHPAGAAVEAPGEGDLATVARWQAEARVLLAELAARRSRTRQATLPTEITVSTVVDVSRAPDDLAQRLVRPVPQRPVPAARRGTEFHSWVEARSGQRQLLDPGDLPGAADAALGDSDLGDLQAHFLRTPYAARVPVEVEVPFEMTLAGHLVRGRIDAVYADDDGGFDVIDYKTGRQPAGAAAESSAVQLSCYRLAWAALAGVPLERVRAGFLYVADEVVVRPAVLHGEAELSAMLTGLPAG
jgi:DNA helicase-2/ATP-dependent DNA helicase PcrA